MKTGLKESNLVIDAQVNRVLGSCRCYHCLPFQQLLESIGEVVDVVSIIIQTSTHSQQQNEKHQYL